MWDVLEFIMYLFEGIFVGGVVVLIIMALFKTKRRLS